MNLWYVRADRMWNRGETRKLWAPTDFECTEGQIIGILYNSVYTVFFFVAKISVMVNGILFTAVIDVRKLNDK